MIELTDEERTTRPRWSRGKTTPVRPVSRANIILRAAEGLQSKQISAELGIPEKTICKWRKRFADRRLAGIEQDAARGGRTPTVRAEAESEIIRETTQETPP